MKDGRYSFREMRILSDTSIDEAAKTINVHTITLYNKEKYQKKFSLYEAIKLCKLYGFELSDIDENSIIEGE